MKIRPFRKGDTHSTFQNLIEKAKQEIDALENDYILKASSTELEQYYIGKVSIMPLVLHSDQYYIDDQKGTKIDVSHDFRRAVFPGERAVVQGTQLDIAIPYEGDPVLWGIRASTFSHSPYPELDIRDDTVVFTIQFPDDSANSDTLKKQIDSAVQDLTKAVGYLKNDVEQHNASAPEAIKMAIERKRQKALSTTNAVANLGIPIKRSSQPPTFTIPTQRRKAPISRPVVSKEAYKPEPILDEAEYNHILDILRSMSLVMERSPATFISLDEEAIRTHFLIQLNGHYEGDATGETFNASGKTDILIRVGDRNVFVAECKFWRGPKSFSEAIDQLLSYLSWRDSKCALLIFNKTKDSSAVRNKMHEIMESRPENRCTQSYDPDGDARYVFVKESDPGKEIVITTMLFDIPQEEKRGDA